MVNFVEVQKSSREIQEHYWGQKSKNRYIEESKNNFTLSPASLPQDCTDQCQEQPT